MDDKRITAEQLVVELEGEIMALAEQMAEAMNQARDGHIIADSEEPVRDAHAVFRQQAYQKAIDLLGEHVAGQAFSPSAERGRAVEEQGAASDLASDGQRPGAVET